MDEIKEAPIKEAPEKQTFVIDDDNKANWAFRKLAEVKQ
ncbi:nuclease inhibitor protein, partial [Lentilactobacillus buchneri]|nr:nuclease inhibitor protein [Lentilactobacillus buchneri]